MVGIFAYDSAHTLYFEMQALSNLKATSKAYIDSVARRHEEALSEERKRRLEAERLLESALRAWQAASVEAIQQSSHESAQAALKRATQKRERDTEFALSATADLCAARARIAELEAQSREHAERAASLDAELLRYRAAPQGAAAVVFGGDRPVPLESTCAADESADAAQTAAEAAAARAAAAEAALARKDEELRELDERLRRVTADARLALERYRAPSPSPASPARLSSLSRLLEDERARRLAAEAQLAAARDGAARAVEAASALRAFGHEAAEGLLARVRSERRRRQR